MPRKAKKQKPFNFFQNFGGIDEDSGVFTIQPSAAELIQNLHVDKYGQFTSHDQGASDFGGAYESGNRIDSIHSYKTDTGSDFIIIGTNDKFIRIDPTNGVSSGTINSSKTAAKPGDVQNFKGDAYLVEETMVPEVWTGTGSSTAVSGIPLTVGSDVYDKPSLVETYANRLVYANFHGTTKYPSHIAISDDLAPDTFTIGTNTTDAAVIQVNPGDGEELTALKTVYVPALDQNYLLCFKEDSVYAVSGTTPNPSGDLFQVIKINGSYGAVNNRSVVEVGADIYFIGNKNIYSLATSTQSGNLQPNVLGNAMVAETLRDMNVTQKSKCWAVHLPFREEVWFGIPTGSATEVDKVLVYKYDSDNQKQPLWTVRTGMDITAAHVYEGTLYTGTSDSHLDTWFNHSQYDGTGYNWVYRYPYFDFGTANQYKRITDLDLYFKLRANQTVTVKTKWRMGGNDIQKSYSKTITVPSDTTWDNFNWDEASWASESGGTLKRIRIPVIGNGEQFQLEVSGTTASTGITFLGAKGIVEFGDFIRRYN